MYKCLIKANAKVVCVFVTKKHAKGTTITVEWHPLISPAQASQAHFWSSTCRTERKILHPILQSIGLKISSAPPKVMNCINNVMAELDQEEQHKVSSDALCVNTKDFDQLVPENDSDSNCDEIKKRKIPLISPRSMFEYYTEHSPFSCNSNMKPCPITDTVFQDPSTFLVFIKYLVQLRLETPQTVTDIDAKHTFPKPPFMHYLMLTADGTLKNFDQDNKILNSVYYHLYPKHLDKFLHPTLRAINFDSSYFISHDEDENQEKILSLILEMFSDTFPRRMQNAKVVLNASSVIEICKLQDHWKCFDEDEVFKNFLPEFLKHWALLLTTDNRLFSTSNEVLPTHTYVDPSKDLDPVNGIVQTMMRETLKMPFLNSDVVIASVNCPKLTEHDRILSNFFHANKVSPLASVIGRNMIDVLIRYFSSEAKPTNPEWVKHIQSLPFFENVMGKYLPVFNTEAFIWPDSALSLGYTCWMSNIDAVFIQSSAKWCTLGSAEQLSIHAISAEKVYTDFIFPNFDKLNETERYQHLKHIKDYMYIMNKNRNASDAKDERKCDSLSFIAALKELKCVGLDSSRLNPISSFCDHTVNIFVVFFNDFHTLPKQLKSKDWLKFFRELGIKVMLTQDEYLNLCKKTAAKNVNNVKKCSNALIEYIFSDEVRKLWWRKLNFLHKVSDIAFMHTVDTSSVEWIVPGFCQASQLVKLNGATVCSLMELLWTVRPVIKLPSCTNYVYPLDETTVYMLNGLNIVHEATIGRRIPDIVSNIKNICNKSCYASESLFTNYPSKLLSTGRSRDVMDIMYHNLKFLDENGSVKNNIISVMCLAELPCIPVYCDLLVFKRCVLVKPSCVIASTSEAHDYHPYLHSLPPRFSSLSTLLLKLGVIQNLELCHVQIFLEKLFKKSEGMKLDPNAKESVKKAMEFLNFKISFESKSGNPDIGSSLYPLYLPDTNDELKISTMMLYGDTQSYLCHIKLNLKGTPYSHFDIIEDNYGVDALDICRLLPEQVRPLGMSEKCNQVPHEACVSAQHSELSLNIENSLKLKGNPQIIVKVFNKIIKLNIESVELADVVSMVTTFLSSFKIVTKHNLRTQLVLKDSSTTIGRLKTDFYFESRSTGSVLYIDSDLDSADGIVTEIAEEVCRIISQNIPDVISWQPKLKRVINFIEQLLKTRSQMRRQQLLEKYRLDGVNVEFDGEFVFELGKDIPLCYCHRLNQDPYNIFKPMEYVGYEEKEGHITGAQVMSLVKTECDDGLHRVYHIFTSKTDSEGKNVSILDLYKFLVGSREDNSAIIPYTAEDDVVQPRKSLYEGDTAEIKEHIRRELVDIWKLSQESQNKALRRLYLKWHPDKNLEYPERAQDIFTFLRKEVERFKELSENEEDVDFSFYMEKWDAEAKLHRHTYRQEESHANFNTTLEDVKEQERPEEGKRWLKQASKDYSVLCDILSNGHYGHACFMAHQVVEKALKGGVYALCGMDGRGLIDHHLERHADALWTAMPAEASGLAQHSTPLEQYYLNTRYPNRWSGTDIPSDHYTAEEAEQAKGHAKEVLDIVKSIMPV